MLVIGIVLLGTLVWVGTGKTLAEDDTHLGPPVVVPSPTATATQPEPSEEPTLDTSQRPTPPPDSNNSTGAANGADRIKPGPPRTAGHDDDDDDDADDADDADDDDDDGDDDDD